MFTLTHILIILNLAMALVDLVLVFLFLRLKMERLEMLRRQELLSFQNLEPFHDIDDGAQWLARNELGEAGKAKKATKKKAKRKRS